MTRTSSTGLSVFRTYTDINDVANDFGTTAPEYLAAALFFSQVPKPATCMIGRWFATAAAAQNDGGILSSAQQTLNLWTSIGNGGFDITVDGAALTLTGLNFTACTNMNGVAAVIQTALQSAASESVLCTWTGSNFVITSATTGLGLPATGTVTFSGTTTANDTLTINGRTLTFVSGTPAAHQVQIGGSAAQTAANLQAYLMSAPALADADLNVCSYSTLLAVTTITANAVGTAGNSIAISKSSTEITLSAADLAGGTVASSVGYATSPTSSYTDISAQLQLTAATAQTLVPGFNAEQPVQCLEALASMSTVWYGSMFAATASIITAQYLACAAFIEPQDITRTFGITTSDTNSLSSLATSDVGYQLQQLGYNQSFVQYASTNPYACASFFGRAFSVDFTGNNTTITLMFKNEPGIVAEQLTQAQANALKAKNVNVFVAYSNGTSLLQYGTVASGQFFDTIQGCDWLQNAIQTAVFNVLYTQPKVPQTNPGANQLVNAASGACGQGVTNGLVAPGVWNGPSFGQITTGQYLKAGYYVYMPDVNLQSEADRATRAAPPSQIAIKLAGAFQSADFLVNINA